MYNEQEEKELRDINILIAQYSGTLNPDLAKAIIARYPQITKKPLKQIWSGDIRDLHLTKIVDLLKFISDQKTRIKVYVEVVS